MQSFVIGSAASVNVPDQPTTGEYSNAGLSFCAPIEIDFPKGWREQRSPTCASHRVNVEVYPSKELAVGAAGRDLFEHLLRNPEGATGTATGNTYLPIYAETVRLFKEHRANGAVVNLARHQFFGLDEYFIKNGDNGHAIDPAHPESFRGFMHKHLGQPLSLPVNPNSLTRWGNFWMPAPNAGQEVGEACLVYERARSQARVQRQYVGIGKNGHIAFLEPREGPNAEMLFWTRTRLVNLSPSTRLANFGRVDSEIDSAISVGLQTILDSGHVVLVALGDSKAEAIAAALEGPIGPHCPASYLRLLPTGRVTFIVDQAAASKLSVTK